MTFSLPKPLLKLFDSDFGIWTHFSVTTALFEHET